MTKSFVLNDLKTNDGAAASGSSDGRNKAADDEKSSPAFPFMAFRAPRSTKAAAVAEPTYTAQDLAAAVEEARRTTALEVEARTRAALAADLEHRQVEALEAIRDQLRTSEEQFVKWMSDVSGTAQSLAKMMGKAMVPKALELQPLADIGDMLRQSLERLVDQPSIELRLEGDLVEQAAGLLSEVAASVGFQGELTTVADPTLGAGGAKLFWKNGAAQRDFGRI